MKKEALSRLNTLVKMLDMSIETGICGRFDFELYKDNPLSKLVIDGIHFRNGKRCVSITPRTFISKSFVEGSELCYFGHDDWKKLVQICSNTLEFKKAYDRFTSDEVIVNDNDASLREYMSPYEIFDDPNEERRS